MHIVSEQYQSIEWPPIAFSSSHNSQWLKASSNVAGSPPGTGGYEACASTVMYFAGNRAVREQVRKLILPWSIMISVSVGQWVSCTRRVSGLGFYGCGYGY